jgi:hypothetical protein
MMRAINPDDIDEDLLLDDIIVCCYLVVLFRDAVMRSITTIAYVNNAPPAAKKVKIPRDVYPRKKSSSLFSYRL